MATATQTSTPENVATPLDHPYLLTAEQYSRMIEAGVFGKKDRVVLWKGRLVETMTKGRPHSIAVGCTFQALSRLVPDGWYVEQEQPLIIAEDGMPEPDLMVVRGNRRDYPRRPPAAKDVALIIEVADSSLAEDQGDVLTTYAAQAIPIYWIINIPQRRVEVFSVPTGPAGPAFYRAAHQYGPTDQVPVEIDGREVGRIAVHDLLP